MHDCLNLHRKFSRGFASQRHSTEYVRRRKGGSYIFKTVFQAPVCFATAATQMAQFTHRAACELEHYVMRPNLYPMSMAYGWDSHGEKSFANLQCLCCWGSLHREWMGSILCLCNTRPFTTARWACWLFHGTGSIMRLMMQFSHQSFDFSICCAEQEWEHWEEASYGQQLWWVLRASPG